MEARPLARRTVGRSCECSAVVDSGGAGTVDSVCGRRPAHKPRLHPFVEATVPTEKVNVKPACGALIVWVVEVCGVKDPRRIPMAMPIAALDIVADLKGTACQVHPKQSRHLQMLLADCPLQGGEADCLRSGVGSRCILAHNSRRAPQVDPS